MSESTRRYLLSCGIVLLVACLCLAALAVIGLGIRFLTPSSSESGDLRRPTVTGGLPFDLDGTPTIFAGMPIPDEVARVMDRIELEVMEYRGLQPTGPVTRVLMTPAQLHQRVVEDFFGDYTEEEARLDAIILSAFGLLERDYDLYTMYIDLYSDGIAGFYDPETQEMVIIQGDAFQGIERLTYAHEYTHVLQDQTYDLRNGLNWNDEACQIDSERCAAIQALIEGDASLSEITWLLEYATLEEYQQIFDSLDDIDMSTFEAAPAFIQEDFTFPYTHGYEFVNYLFDGGDWSAVDGAYGNLPTSTEQILHPERYPNDNPIPVPVPSLDAVFSGDWELVDSGVMGEWYTYLILGHGEDASARLGDFVAGEAAEGWGGDAYAVYYDETSGHLAMAMDMVWDSPAEAEEFIDAFEIFTSQRYTSPTSLQGGQIIWDTAEGYTALHFLGDRATWILAPNAEIGEAMWEAMQN